VESVRIHFEKYFMKKRSIYNLISGKVIPVYGTKFNLYFIITMKFSLLKIWRLELYYFLHKQSMEYDVFFAYFFANFKGSTLSAWSSYASPPPNIGQQKIPLSLCYKINTHCKAVFLLRFERYSSCKETPKRIWLNPLSF